MDRLLFLKNEHGASMLEYGLLAALISVAAIAAIRETGRQSCRAMAMATCAQQCHTTSPAAPCVLRGTTLEAHCRDHVNSGGGHGLTYDCN